MAYNVLFPVQAIVNGDMSQPQIVSIPVEVKYQDNIGIQLTWTGTPIGTFDVQVSSSSSQQNNVSSWAWVSLPYKPIITAAGSADAAYIDLNQLSAMFVRVVYNQTSASVGTLQCLVVGKAI